MKPAIVIFMIFSLVLVACSEPEAVNQPVSENTEVDVAPADSTVQSDVAEATSEPAEETASKTNDQPSDGENAEAQATMEDAPAAEIAQAEDMDWLLVSNRVDLALSVLGNPEAPVTMIEYSDFM
ncbi:MAG: hypothetical protein AAF629_18540 [Chloroflexota bacterium]